MMKLIRINSIRTKNTLVLLIIIIPLIVLLIMYNFYAIGVFRDNTAQSNRMILSLYTEALDKELEKVDAFLLDIVAVNPSYNILRQKNSNMKVYNATYHIVNMLEQSININDKIDMFFLYGKTNKVTREVYKGVSDYSYSFQEKEQIREGLFNLTASGENFVSDGWMPYKIGDRYFLLRIFGSKGTYVGAVIDVEHLMAPLNKIAFKKNETIIYNTNQGLPLLKQSLVERNQIDLLSSGDTYHISGSPSSYMVISEKLAAGDIYMTALIPETSIFQGLNNVQLILLMISVLTILIIPFSIYLLRRTVLTPLGHLVDGINSVKDGEWNTRMESQVVTEEFRLVNDTINDMVDEIKSLKIAAYEEKIEKQKVELQYLMFQIKPHFFLNALKNLYGMAERKQYQVIQDIILGLSNHFRYMFKDNFTLVSLASELGHVQNYIKIQQLSLATTIEVKMDIDHRFNDFKIPPLIIQTFVENSLKHGVVHEQALRLSIKASLLKSEVGDFLDIIVADNGPGFTQGQLTQLNFEERDANDNNHIGIVNVEKRLKLIFGQDAQVFFSNGNKRGAVSEIIIPMGSRNEEGGNNEYIDY